jgi:predicted homoserine dehydrogenase-like protein
LGSFAFRGETFPFEQHRDFVPIGLLQDCQLIDTIREGDRVRWDHVTVPDSLALRLFNTLLEE